MSVECAVNAHARNDQGVFFNSKSLQKSVSLKGRLAQMQEGPIAGDVVQVELSTNLNMELS